MFVDTGVRNSAWSLLLLRQQTTADVRRAFAVCMSKSELTCDAYERSDSTASAASSEAKLDRGRP